MQTKKLFCQLFFLTLGVTVFGQDKNLSKRFSYGIKAGGNYSTIKIKNGNVYAIRVNETGGRLAYNAGAYLTFNINKNFSLVSELYYSVQGGDASRAIGPYPSTNYKHRITYARLPVLARYNFIPKAFVEVGPEIALLLSAKYLNSEDNYDTYFSSSAKPFFHEKDFSVLLGAGFIINPKLTINLRYDYGLYNINKEGFTYRKGKWYNRTAQVNLFYKITE
jgi:outer membrane immunogenic protein